MQNFRNEWGKLEITEKITKNCSHIGREKYTKTGNGPDLAYNPWLANP